MLGLLAHNDIADLRAARRVFYLSALLYFVVHTKVFVVEGSWSSFEANAHLLEALLAVIVVFVAMVTVAKVYLEIIIPRKLIRLKEVHDLELYTESGRQQVRELDREIAEINEKISSLEMNGIRA